MSWAQVEANSTSLPDARLKGRLEKVLTQLSSKPTQSIPAACGNWQDAKAAYRFFDNDRVNAADILDGHTRATLERISRESVVLLLQDTTFLSYEKDVKGHQFGTLRIQSREEYLLHPSVAFTADRVNLGVLGHHFWQRPEKPVGHERHKKAIEEKESYRWLLGYEMACAVQSRYPETLVVNIADREGDIHEWFLAGEFDAEGADRAGYVIRAKCDRRVSTGSGKHSYLWKELEAAPVLGTTEVEISRRPGRRARVAKLSVRGKTVTFNRARRVGGQLPPATVSAIYVKETSPPKGEQGLEWMLLTNLPVANFEAAQQVIGWYRARWEEELYFRIVKQGCKIEDLRLETPERLERCIAVYLIVAWRIHYLTQIARSVASAPCTQAFSEPEWQTIYLLHMKKAPPKKPPAMREMVRMLAKLGGFLGRKSDGEPGSETVWRGYIVLLQSMAALEIAAAVGQRE
jgi:hypothetical protein